MASAPQHKALLKFLDSFYHEIVELEQAHGMTISNTDLRPPIEHYNTVVQALGGHKTADSPRLLSVDSLSADLQRLRDYTDWLAGGGHVFLKNHDFQQARQNKRKLLLAPSRLQLPTEVLLQDLADFARYVKPSGTSSDTLESELRTREAQHIELKSGGAKYSPYPAKLFWSEFQDALHVYKAVLGDADATLLPSGSPKAREKAARDHLRQLTLAEEKLRFFWIQAVHPLNLLATVKLPTSEGGTLTLPATFDPGAFIAEQDWQANTRDSRRLAELYANYTVLFAAATQDTVNRSYKDLIEELDSLIGDGAELMELIEQVMKASDLTMGDLEQAIDQCPDEDLKRRLQIMLHEQMQERNRRDSKVEACQAAIKTIEGVIQSRERSVDALEKAHFNYLSSQLMVYHEQPELIKKFASQGLNIAGKFVGVEAGKDTGRGRGGQGR